MDKDYQGLSLPMIREEIDAIDNELMALLWRRMDCSSRVAAYKMALGLPVLNEEREQQILNRVRESGEQMREGYGDAAALIFAATMDASRALQHRQLSAGDALRAQIVQAKRTLPRGDEARVVCQGVAGAYSDEAAAKLFPGCAPLFVDSFEQVFTSVENGSADFGLLPVENSSAGSVHEVYDLVIHHRFTIAASVEVPIHHCLLAVPGANPAQLRTVYSHQQGLAQCKEFIEARGLTACAYRNTASAAQMVAAKGDPSLCAIASKRAAEIYRLDILEKNIHTVNHNCTRFIAISRDLTIPENANKISLLFALPHVTGSLYRTLSRFAMAGLSLTKIESRPMRTGEFEYIFYLDFLGSLQSPATVDLLCGLSEEMPAFTFLGNYYEME